MTTPEGKIKDKVKAYLDSIGAYYFMPVQMGYGKRTLDFLCCINTRFVAIETKAAGKKIKPLQEAVAGHIRAAKGWVVYISCDEHLETFKFYVHKYLL